MTYEGFSTQETFHDHCSPPGDQLTTGLAVTSVMVVTPQSDASSGSNSGEDEANIRRAMAAYNVALNGGKTAAVLPLYTPDGVFMAPYSDSSIGIEAIRTAYEKVFQELAFDVRFEIKELVLLSPSYAYVRTNSAGTTRHASTGKTTSEANQELFILRNSGDGGWRIARYSFSPTNPPAND